MTKTDKGKAQTPEEKREDMQKKIAQLGNDLVKEVDQGENLHIDIPIRGSANVLFDEKQKKILLGDKMAKRFLFNVAHARRFMQTMLVASYVKKDLLENNLTATLRDLYYAKKRTIKGFKEDTIDEQKESDLAIVDLEVAMDSFRERLHLRAEPKGRMAGDLTVLDRVRDKVDSIDLSRMGSGGWAVPSIVEQIEFKDVGIEYVLVAEKNAIFDRLNEDGYWKKNKCLLMTTAGQAARGARRLLQRLSSELKVPCYCLSIDGNEPIVIVDEKGTVKHPTIKEYVDGAMVAYGIIDGGYYERTIGHGKALQVSKEGQTTVGNVINAIRHPIFEDLYEVTATSGYSARVTASQSLMVFDSEKFAIVPKAVKDLSQNDYLVCPSKAPNNESASSINIIEEIQQKTPDLKNDVEILVETKFIPFKAAIEKIDPSLNHVLRYKKSVVHFPSIIQISPEFCRLLGYYAAEGSSTRSARLSFGGHEKEYLEDAIKCIEKTFKISAKYYYSNKQRTAATIDFGGRFAKELFLQIFECGFHAIGKQIPPVIFNVPNAFKIEFLRGYFRGDGNLKFSPKGCKLWGNTISRKLAADLTLIIHQLGGWVTVNKKPVRGKKMKHEAYHVGITDRKTLKLFSEIVMDLAKDKASAVKEYLTKNTSKLSIYRTLPSIVVKQVQEAFYRTTGHGLSPLVNNQKRIAFEKLEPLIKNTEENALYRDKILEYLPLGADKAVKTSEIAKSLDIKFITVFKSLNKWAKLGFVSNHKIKGDYLWFKIKNNFIETETRRRLSVLKNLIDNKIVLLDVKKIEKVTPTSELVYDIEVFPTHTFIGGVGGLQLKNTDSDPYGWYIYSTMKYGSMALAHESERLGCPELKFLGMSTSDIEHYDLSSVTIKAKEVDIKRAEEMKSYAWFKTKEWQAEINLFLEKKLKAEIQALSSKNLQYISKTYLPEKIKNKDFLP